MISAPPRARLGPRLRAVLELCPTSGRVADIGSGHGRVALELAASRPPGSVFATEVRPGPAYELRRMLGEASPVTVLEGWGLRPLAGLGVEGAVIAGMGGRTAAAILEADPAVLRELAWVCLQPMQRWEWLNAWMAGRPGWSAHRTLTLERGRAYHTFLWQRR